jgi:hypothetical protein
MKNTFKSIFLLCILSFMLQSCSDSTSSEERRQAQAERDRKALKAATDSESFKNAMKAHIPESPTADEDMRRRESERRLESMEAKLKRQQMELDEMKERMHKQETDRFIPHPLPSTRLSPLPTRLSPLEP